MPAHPATARVDVVRLWQLPDDFFARPLDEQWAAVKAVTAPAPELAAPRRACVLSFTDDALATGFFLATLALPFGLALSFLYFLYHGSRAPTAALVVVAAVLALHPLPRAPSLAFRSSRLALALARYFTMEMLCDRSDPFVTDYCTPGVDAAAFLERSLPSVYLACPHGVFNYGAMVWCCFMRWACGWYQYTGAAAAVRHAPGLRLMDPLIWLIEADRKSITAALRERGPLDAVDGERKGGVVGMVPDGILGAFRSRPGRDELAIGKRRGLLRICLQEGAVVHGAWFFGTPDMLTVVQDPFGIMEFLSRKARAGVMYFYGRWFLPVPRRVAVTVCVAPVSTVKTADPSRAALDALHDEVYGKLQKVYDDQKRFAGYPDRTLIIT